MAIDLEGEEGSRGRHQYPCCGGGAGHGWDEDCAVCRNAAAPQLPGGLRPRAIRCSDGRDCRQEKDSHPDPDTQGRASEATYAAEASGKLLELLESYFGIPCPSEKLDKVALPLVGFAMENPGLITYGEALLPAKPEQDVVARRRGFTSVAAHEMAHQWFGDLVTMRWWNDLWLNEAFASWMGETIENRFRPDWNIRVQALDTKAYAMGAGQPCERAAHPAAG